MSIAIIGDSYAKGYLLPREQDRWSTLFCQRAGEVELNLSESGSGYCWPGTGATFPQQAARAVALQPDVVLVTGGHNDSVSDKSEAEIRAAVQLTLDTLRDGLPLARILVISPFWHYLQPSPRILAVAQIVQTEAAARGLRTMTGAMWWRFEQPSWSYGDGHPNEVGHRIIADAVYAWLFGRGVTESFGKFVRETNGDSQFSAPNGANFVTGTIRNARAGRWLVVGKQSMYGSAAGWTFLSANGTRIHQRADVANANSAFPLSQMDTFWHPGGDLTISTGYRTAVGAPWVVGAGSCMVQGSYVERGML